MLGGVLIGAIAVAVLWLAGSAVVLDRTGKVDSAFVTTSDGRQQSLARLPGRLFYAIPKLEGAIELHCRDGSREQWGYVTAHIHTWVKVVPGPGCGTLISVG